MDKRCTYQITSSNIRELNTKFFRSSPLEVFCKDGVLKDTNGGLFLLSSYVVIDYNIEYVVLQILKLHMCSFNGCSLI